MKLAEIISRSPWQEVEPVYLELYPKEKRQKKKAREALEYIKSLKPIASKMRIEIEYCEAEEGHYHEVLGKDGTLRPDGPEERYDISLVDWDEWLGIEIDPLTQNNYSELAILCHCLYEMTWYGYSMAKIKKFRDEL